MAPCSGARLYVVGKLGANVRLKTGFEHTVCIGPFKHFLPKTDATSEVQPQQNNPGARRI